MFVVVLTGAGISADSGVATFRDPDGVWAQVDYREVATPEGFASDPDKVHAFYNRRRAGLSSVDPNGAHRALVLLERELIERGDDFLLITQNVDDLHDRAGSERLLPMHGRLDRMRCAFCGHEAPCDGDLSTADHCPQCDRPGGLRPAVVWFGEMPLDLERIEAAIGKATHFAAIGTSGSVYPAAGLVQGAKAAGAHTTLINLEAAENASMFDEHCYGTASETVPAWAERLLAG